MSAGDFHSPAYFLAGRSVAAVQRFLPLADLDCTDPDAVLAAARKEIAAALGSPNAERLLSLCVGAVSQRQGAARNAEWDAVTNPLMPAIAMGQARKFVSNHFAEIQRLARTMLSERKLSVGMVCWILDSKPRLAA